MKFSLHVVVPVSAEKQTIRSNMWIVTGSAATAPKTRSGKVWLMKHKSFVDIRILKKQLSLFRNPQTEAHVSV
jgi:hypothetical protein